MPLWLVAQPYQIGNRSITLNDPSRGGRAIGIEVFYPAASSGSNVPVISGDFPLLVFGHGFTMDYDAYQNFWEELVPEGYIIALATTETGFSPSHGNFGADLSYMVNWFLQQNTTPASPFFDCLNGKSAVMGHSMGGGASFLAASQNPNITVLATFAPAETNPSAVSAAGNLSIPALIFSGGRDNVTPPADHQIPMYNALQSDCKTRVTIDNGAHCRFANSNTLCQTGEAFVCIGCNFLDRAIHHQRQFTVLLPFLDFYLKGNCNAWTTWQNVLSNPSGYSVVNSCNYALPGVGININGDTALCTIDTTYLQAQVQGSGDLLWSTGETTSQVVVTNPGQYTITLTDALGCEAVDVVSINAYNVVKPVITAVSGSTICAVDTTLLSVNSSYAQYNWSTGATTNEIEVTSAGDYYVSVIDNNGCTAVSDTLTITVNNVVQPVINAISGLALCAGDSTLLTVSSNYAQYNWSTGATTNEIQVSSGGDYYVSVTDNNGCSAVSDTLTVTVNNAVQPILNAQSGTTFCEGDSTTLSVTNPYADYTWSTGAITSEIQVTTAGDYYVTVIDNNGCSAVSDTLTVNVDNVVSPVISLQSALTFCDGDSVELSVTSVYVSYNWSTGDTNNEITVSTAGDYYVSVIDNNGCSSSSDTVTVQVNQPTANPVLTYTNDSLYASGGTLVSWYQDGNLLSGITDDFLYPVTPGDYEVVVADANGCVSRSTIFTVQEDSIINGLSLVTELTWNVYPNPTNGLLVVDFEGVLAEVRMYNPAGQEVFPPKEELAHKVTLDMSMLSGNLYFIQLESNGKSYIRKVFVQH